MLKSQSREVLKTASGTVAGKLEGPRVESSPDTSQKHKLLQKVAQITPLIKLLEDTKLIRRDRVYC